MLRTKKVNPRSIVAEVVPLVIPEDLAAFWPAETPREMDYLATWRSRAANQNATMPQLEAARHAYRIRVAQSVKAKRAQAKERGDERREQERIRRTCQVCAQESLDVESQLLSGGPVEPSPQQSGQMLDGPGGHVYLPPVRNEDRQRNTVVRVPSAGQTVNLPGRGLVLACRACCLVLADLARQRAAEDVLADGRSRAAVAAAFLG